MVYSFTGNKSFSDWSLKDQIQRAAVSVISNIAEGFERGTREEFIYFLYIAKGSCAEVRAQSYVAFDIKFISDKDLEKLIILSKLVAAMIYKLIESLKVSKYKGLKFKTNPSREKNDFQAYLKSLIPEKYKNS